VGPLLLEGVYSELRERCVRFHKLLQARNRSFESEGLKNARVVPNTEILSGTTRDS